MYDPHRRYDNPPIEGPCYLIHIDSGLGRTLIAKALVDPLNKEIADLKSQLAATKAQQPTTIPQSQIDQAASSISSIFPALQGIAAAATSALDNLKKK